MSDSISILNAVTKIQTFYRTRIKHNAVLILHQGYVNLAFYCNARSISNNIREFNRDLTRDVLIAYTMIALDLTEEQRSLTVEAINKKEYWIDVFYNTTQPLPQPLTGIDTSIKPSERYHNILGSLNAHNVHHNY